MEFHVLNSSNLMNCRFMAEMMIATLIFIIHLKKKNNFWIRYFGGACLLIGGASFIGLGTGKFLLETLITVGFVRFCCPVSWSESIFIMLCAYITQHFSYSLYDILNVYFGISEEIPGFFWIVFPVTLVLFYFLFARNMSDNGNLMNGGGQILAMMIIVLTVVLLLSTFAQVCYCEYGGPIYLISHLYSMFCCLFLMWIQINWQREIDLRTELAVQKSLWSKQQEQYQMSRDNINIINRKCHDLKHQIRALREIGMEKERDEYISQIEKSINIYDSNIRTGNEVLDTILTEKKLYCESHDITLNCVIDGKKLSFMKMMDIYALFGNAIDNAIESVIKTEDRDKRLIYIREWEQGGLLLIQVDNYCEQKIVIKDGLPISTKGDNTIHGYGLKSIKNIIEQYDGCIKITIEKKKFQLLMSIPIA